MLEVSLVSSWPKDSPRMEASGFPEPVGPEIRKNVFNKYFLCPKKLPGNDVCILQFKSQISLLYENFDTIVNTT